MGVVSRPVLSVDSSEEHASSKRGEGKGIAHGINWAQWNFGTTGWSVHVTLL